MKTFTKILLLAVLSMQISGMFAYSSLRVQNPNNWDSQTGVIEDVVLTVRPHGIYLQYDLYLTFSAGDWQYKGNDTLEIQYYFNLPEHAIVNDAWLWVGDDIVKAKIMSRWEAYQIYEEIVSRRKDPLVMYKDWGDNYQARIYPLFAGETRKIKISYLVPAIWTEDKVYGELPTDLLMSSAKLPDLKVRVFANKQFPNPAIKNHSEIRFKAMTATTPEIYTQAIVPAENFDELLKIQFDSPMQDGIFFSTYEDGTDEGFYQMVMMPKETIGIEKEKNFMIVVNIEDSRYDMLHPDDVMGYLNDFLLNICSEADNYNILVTGKENYLISKKWIPAEKTNIESSLKLIGSKGFSTDNILPGLIDAHSFIKEKGGDGTLVVITNKREYEDNTVDANDYIKEIREKTGVVYPVNIITYSYLIDWDKYYKENKRYYGWWSNFYQLANQTYGKLLYLNQQNYYYDIGFVAVDDAVNGAESVEEEPSIEVNAQEVFLELYETTGNIFALLDIYSTCETGVCYGRFNPGIENFYGYQGQPIMQLGKYNGKAPFYVEVAGEVEGDFFGFHENIPENQILESDSLLKTAWFGNYIESLENSINYSYSNDVIHEIVKKSVENRVLSRYTAFLALEPSDTISVCKDCVDETGSWDNATGGDGNYAMEDGGALVNGVDGSSKENISTDIQQENETMSIDVYPNPFADKLFVQLDDIPVQQGKVSILVYNMYGQLVKVLFSGDLSQGNSQFMWDGTNASGKEVTSGQYIIVIESADMKEIVKVTKM